MRDTPPVEDLGNGIWSIPVPIPGNPLGYTLVYALETPRGPVLVDAGWQHEDSWRALTAGLRSIGADPSGVHGVVVTHFHPDHAGLAGRVREASGCWIAMHHADIDVLRRIEALGGLLQDETETAQLRLAGAPEEEVAAYALLDTRMDPPALPDTALAHGELVDAPGRKLRAVWTPGHSPGHICLHLEDGDHLFTGDHVLPRITPHIGLYPFTEPGGGPDDRDPLGSFLDSLALIPDIGAAHALPAHERRFDDLPGRTREIIAHHEERLDVLAGALGPAPLTLWELTASLPWSRGWDAMSVRARRMAASETAAHLRTLERRGRAAPSRGPGGVLLWQRP
ncbi:MBL fold metallo-hydrolase [Nocardiopsis potens]|uniref:MBL fold metallo-hydrolase n=1 Tax=Nocardiopsis potens TaxID=1246458 RepID=UPI00037A1138|nr:MBL fold metallo-hydrolase [Nocardiopsis potens]